MSNEPKVDLAGVDELVGRLRDDWPEILVEKHWMMDSDAIDEQREEAATALQSLAAQLAEARAENERLREALAKIADGTMPRPLGEPWRMDMTSSKHDRCVHGAWMYEPCEGCIDAFIASVLGGANG